MYNFRPMPYEQPGVMLSDTSHASKEREANENVEVDHEYEVLDKYSQAYEDVQVSPAPPPKQEQQQSSSAGDYELTQCPAYVPVTHGNKQTETTLTQPPTTEVEGKGHGVSRADDDNKDNETYETMHWVTNKDFVSVCN